jgi:hypothetical protein
VTLRARVDSAGVVRLEFHDVDESRWPDFERLFESRGAPSYCWCMAWRVDATERRQTVGAKRKPFMKKRVLGGVPVGLLGYVGGEPVAWCSIAPRATYAKLVDDCEPHDGIWSIACFFISRRLRRAGALRGMIDAAVAHALARGARVVEAYPVDAGSPSYRHMGRVSTFAAAGFREMGMAGSRRHVMRLELATPMKPRS